MNSSWLTTSFQRVLHHPCTFSTKHHTITFSTHDHRTEQWSSRTQLNSGISTLDGWIKSQLGFKTLLKTDFYKILQCTATQFFLHIVQNELKRIYGKKIHKFNNYICQRWPFKTFLLRCHCCCYFFCFFCCGGTPFFNFCFFSSIETLVRALSIPARGKWGRESFPIWVGYLVFATFLNTGWEIKCFRCFFIPFTIACCSLSSSSSLALPGHTGGIYSCL